MPTKDNKDKKRGILGLRKAKSALGNRQQQLDDAEAAAMGQKPKKK